MSRNTSKTKKTGKFLNWKILNYVNKILNSYLSTYCPNSTQTKSDTVWQDKLNLTSFFWTQIIKISQWLLESRFLSFMTKVNPNNENETKLDILHGLYSNLTSFFISRKILKYFSNFYYWHLSILFQTSKVK